MQYVIMRRNSENSRFIYRPLTPAFPQIVKDEQDIIIMIMNGSEFFTYNEESDSFTKVIVVDGHIKSIGNDTILDNIDELTIDLNL